MEDIIYNKFSISYSICEFCSYTLDKRIKAGNIYSKCITKTCLDIHAPFVISLCFELTDLSADKNDNNQFRNLIKYKENIVKLIKERICVFNIFYNLCGILFQKSINHYTALAYKVNNNLLNIDHSTLYNDGGENNSEIIFIDDENFVNLINILKKENPLILIYMKN